MKTATTTKTRKVLPPATGHARWVEPLGPADTSAVLEINGTAYVVTVLEDERTGDVLGYQLEKGDGSHYDVDAATWECSCPDATWRLERRSACKHSRGLRAALGSLAQPAAA